ncbi:MAG: ribosome small subunit-dependent GTPase A [Burkholderiales bacterium]|nr:ribosome small subunit-dependent GTPase A [Burkholderiales bacterium]
MTDFAFERLRPFGLTNAIVNRLGLHDPAADAHRLMRVMETQRDEFTLHDGSAEHSARAIPRLVLALQAQETALTIGDWVLAAADAQGDLWIHERIEPVTQIARRANDGRRQPLASNVDTALLVMGLDADFNPRRMERYIAMVRACGVAPVAVLTKADLGGTAGLRAAQLRERLPGDVPILAVNGLSGEARLALAPWVQAGQTLVLLGSSGAGKSTLTNTLTGEQTQDTGGVRRGDGRGRHTTTARSLHRCVEGACIIDTPGLRTWRPDADGESLAAAFGDVAELAVNCRFRDCRHEGEPGCAVRGAVPEDRLHNMRKLLRDAQRVDQTPLDRIQQRRKWKAIGKAGSERSRSKRDYGP